MVKKSGFGRTELWWRLVLEFFYVLVLEEYISEYPGRLHVAVSS